MMPFVVPKKAPVPLVRLKLKFTVFDVRFTRISVAPSFSVTPIAPPRMPDDASR